MTIIKHLSSFKNQKQPHIIPGHCTAYRLPVVWLCRHLSRHKCSKLVETWVPELPPDLSAPWSSCFQILPGNIPLVTSVCSSRYHGSLSYQTSVLKNIARNPANLVKKARGQKQEKEQDKRKMRMIVEMIY